MTNGWDSAMRAQAAQTFHLDDEEMNRRHALTFDTYEIGLISLDEYLRRVVFYQERSCSLAQFKAFMLAQSQPFQEMIAFITQLKFKYGLRTVAVSNEGRELLAHRINTFKMKEFIDIFVCSSFTGLRKPDERLYRLALDLSQAEPHEVIYLDDRPLLVEVGAQLGMRAMVHAELDHTKAILEHLLSTQRNLIC